MTISEKVKQYCSMNKLTDMGDKVLLGLSGGADSVCLLFILRDMAAELGMEIRAVHINHCIRGAEADRDQEFCESLCKSLGIPIDAVRIDVPALALESGMSCEEAGRKARYETFERLAHKYGCTKIAVAHHMNDQAETLLFQLLRGSRLSGLSGIKPKNRTVIRPLLGITRKEIEDYLHEKSAEYVTDSTNLSDEYTRNIIRNRILVDAGKIQSKAVEHIAEAAGYISRVNEFMEHQADALYKKAAEENLPGEIRLNIKELTEAEPLLAEMVMYNAICKVAGRKKDITSGFVNKCLELTGKQTGKSIKIKYGVSAQRVYESLVLRKDSAIDISDSNCNNELIIEEFCIPEERNAIAFIKENTGFPDGKIKKYFDADKLGNHGNVVLRHIHSDDMMTVYTDGRRKKAVDILADAKVGEEARSHITAAALGNEILLIPGIRGSEAFRIDETTRKVTVISVQED